MLNPVQPASLETQADRAVLKLRAALIEVRTKLINSVRGTLKSFGLRLGASSGNAFASQAGLRLPGELRETLGPLLVVIQHVTDEIRRYDKRILELGEKKYPVGPWRHGRSLAFAALNRSVETDWFHALESGRAAQIRWTLEEGTREVPMRP